MKIKSLVLTTLFAAGFVSSVEAADITPTTEVSATSTATPIAPVVQSTGLSYADVAQNNAIRQVLVAPKPIAFKKSRTPLEAVKDLSDLLRHFKGTVFNENAKPAINQHAMYPNTATRCEVMMQDTVTVLYELADVLQPAKATKGKASKGKGKTAQAETAATPDWVAELRIKFATQIRSLAITLKNAIKQGKIEAFTFVVSEVTPLLVEVLDQIPGMDKFTRILKDGAAKLGECSQLKAAADELKRVDISDLPEEI